MPKHKSPSAKAKGGLGGVPKSGHGNKTKRKSKPKRLSIENLIELPDDCSPRGPVLRVTLPTLDEMDDGPAEVPATEEELKRLYKPFPKIEVMDPDTGENAYGSMVHLHDYVQIRAGELAGESVEDTEKWYGQIMYIGARKEAGWAQPDVSSVHVGRVTDSNYVVAAHSYFETNRKGCSNMLENELIASDHLDNIHLTSLMGLVDIIYYDEHSTSQIGVGPSDLFYRRCIAGNRVVGARNNCTTRCKSSYHPKRDIQHFCPRPKCRRWFHTSCMSPKKADYTLLEYNLPSLEQLLVDLVSARTAGKLRSSKPIPEAVFPSAGGSSETEPETPTTATMSPDPPQRPVWLARQLPQELKALATSAITRGLKSGNGIVGNAYAVAKARWMARQVIIDGVPLSSDDQVVLSELSGMVGAEDGISISQLAYQCPGCGYPI
ncbi:hypothetical protein BDV93DRAFT_522278 [Ceratobasidium sp. AG-I]|nr:hypothetical protein BDV93DRAFT_522278 [Ceratobasidium sp. AG-I]